MLSMNQLHVKHYAARVLSIIPTGQDDVGTFHIRAAHLIISRLFQYFSQDRYLHFAVKVFPSGFLFLLH